MVFEWFQARNNFTPSRILKERKLAQFDDMMKERQRSQQQSQRKDGSGNTRDIKSSTMQLYHRFQTISPVSNDKFSATSPGIKSDYNFTNYNKESKTPVGDDNKKKIENFFEAYNSRN